MSVEQLERNTRCLKEIVDALNKGAFIGDVGNVVINHAGQTLSTKPLSDPFTVPLGGRVDVYVQPTASVAAGGFTLQLNGGDIETAPALSANVKTLMATRKVNGGDIIRIRTGTNTTVTQFYAEYFPARQFEL